jgi:thiaminase
MSGSRVCIIATFRTQNKQFSLTARPGDNTKLLMALLACLLGYGEVGLWLRKQASLPDSWVKMDENPYKRWIEDYSGAQYQNAVKMGLGELLSVSPNVWNPAANLLF